MKAKRLINFKDMNNNNGTIKKITSNFMSRFFGTQIYFEVFHKYNGYDTFDNFCDAIKFLNEKQLIIKF